MASTAIAPETAAGETKLREITPWIDGLKVTGTSGRFGDAFNPAMGKVQARVPLANSAELEKAVAAAKAALPSWSAQPPRRRARVMFRFRELFERNLEWFVEIITSEHGKVFPDAKGEATRGLEVVEFATGCGRK